MATERFIIQVTQQGAQQTARAIQGIGTAGRQTQSVMAQLQGQFNRFGQAVSGTHRIMGQFRSILVGLAIANQARAITDLADSFTNARSRISLFTTSAAGTEAAMKRLLQTSNDTGVAFDTSAQLFQRMARASADMNITLDQTLKNVDTLNKLTVISGATSAEATNALIQFSQGLAAGALRGDELRSVVEQIPALAEIIGRKFGIAAGQVAAFAKAHPGILESKPILDALAAAADDINEKYGKIAPTFDRAFTIITNTIGQFIDKLNTTYGISQKLADGARYLAANFDLVVSVFKVLGVTLAAGALLGLPGLLLSIFGTFGSIVLAITAATTALIVFSDQIKITGQEHATLADYVALAWDGLAGVFETIVGWGKQVLDWFTSIQTEIGEATGLTSVWAFEWKALQYVLDAVIKLGQSLINVFIHPFDSLAGAIKGVIGLFYLLKAVALGSWVAISEGAEALGKSIYNSIANAINNVIDGIQRLANIPGNLLGKIGIEIPESEVLESWKLSIYDNIKSPLDIAKASGNEFIRVMKEGADALKELDAKANQRALNREKLKGLQSLNRSGLGQDPLQEVVRGGGDGLKNLDDTISKMRAARKELDNLTRTFGTAFKVADIINDVARAYEKAAKAGVKNLGDLNALTEQAINKELGLIDPLKQYDQEQQKAAELLEKRAINQEQYNRILEIEAKIRDEALLSNDRLLASYDREIAKKLALIDATNALNEAERKSNIEFSPEQRAAYMQAELDKFYGVNDQAKEYKLELEKINYEWERGLKTAEEALAAAREAEIALLNTHRDGASGFRRAMLQLQNDYTDTATQIEGITNTVFGGLSDNLTDLFTKGKADWGSFADQILEDITRMIVQQALLAPLISLLGGGANTGSSIFGGAGGGGFLGSIFGTSSSGGLFGGGGGGFDISSIFSGIGGLLGFATGGQFDVGGNGGTDSQLVAFRATPGEKVTIQTPNESAKSRGDIRVEMNIHGVTDVDSFRKSSGQIAAEFAMQIQRANSRNN